MTALAHTEHGGLRVDEPARKRHVGDARGATRHMTTRAHHPPLARPDAVSALCEDR